MPDFFAEPPKEQKQTQPWWQQMPSQQSSGYDANSLVRFDSSYDTVLRAIASSPSNPTQSSIAAKVSGGGFFSPEELQGIISLAQDEEFWKAVTPPPVQPGLRGGLSGALQMAPEKRTFEISQTGVDQQEQANIASQDRYIMGRQEAESRFIRQREAEQMARLKEVEKKREALKGPQNWMRYMTEVGEKPSWLEYWMNRHGG